jgi:AraC family transcriptional activator of pobA
LYGEPNAAPGPDRLHCESISERSRLHDWEIRPHRHAALCQILLIESGAAVAWLDGETVTLEGPALLTVPALVAHGFRFEPDIQGMVFTLAETHLGALLQGHGNLMPHVMRLRAVRLPMPQAADLLRAACDLRSEAQGHAVWRAAALDAGLVQLAVAIARNVPAANPHDAPAASRALGHIQRLRSLIERQFRKQPTQAALALQLGITPTQLNRACQQILGHPAQHVLHARLMLQAQRELAYTELAIKQVALELGFVDAAYFTRFFRRHAGMTPGAWRARQRAHAAPAD